MIVACAYSLLQNLEGGGFMSIWHGPYIALLPEIQLVVAVYVLFIGDTFLVSLIASWSHSRWCLLLTLHDGAGTHAEIPPSTRRVVAEALDPMGTSIGPHTAAIVEHQLRSKPHPEQGYRACLGPLALARE
jgi:hypothetical protein